MKNPTPEQIKAWQETRKKGIEKWKENRKAKVLANRKLGKSLKSIPIPAIKNTTTFGAGTCPTIKKDYAKERKGLKRTNRNAVKNDKAYREFFFSIPEHERVCVECALLTPEPLILEYAAGYCSHVLSKPSGAAIRYLKKGMVLMCRVHHTQFEFGDRRAMKCYPVLEALTEQLKLENQNLMKRTLK